MADAIGWSETVLASIPPVLTGDAHCVPFTARSTPCAMRVIRPGPSRIAPRISPRAPEFVGWIPCGGDLGDDTLDHRAGEGPGRCPLPPIGYSPRAAPGPRRSNARSRSRACTATPPLVPPRRAGTWGRELWMPRPHDRQRQDHHRCRRDAPRSEARAVSSDLWSSRPLRSQTCDLSV